MSTASARRPRPTPPIRFRELGTWWGVGVNTLVAGFGGAIAGLVLMVPFGGINAWITPLDLSSIANVLVPAVPLASCTAVGFLCGRWWAFVGAVFPLPFFAFLALLAGITSVALLLIVFASTAAALSVGSALRWIYEERRFHRAGLRSP